jgi:hypothetical protein
VEKEPLQSVQAVPLTVIARMLYTWLLVAALAVGGAFADVEHDDSDCCSLEDKKEVAHMWHQVWHSSHTDRKVKIMTAVFDELAEKHPQARELLKQLHIESEDSPEFRAYLIRITQGFDTIINLLEEPLVLEEQVHFLADKFGAKVGIKKSYFEAVADAFEHVLPQVSSCFNIGAWNRCLRRLAHAVTTKVKE